MYLSTDLNIYFILIKYKKLKLKSIQIKSIRKKIFSPCNTLCIFWCVCVHTPREKGVHAWLFQLIILRILWHLKLQWITFFLHLYSLFIVFFTEYKTLFYDKTNNWWREKELSWLLLLCYWIIVFQIFLLKGFKAISHISIILIFCFLFLVINDTFITSFECYLVVLNFNKLPLIYFTIEWMSQLKFESNQSISRLTFRKLFLQQCPK